MTPLSNQEAFTKAVTGLRKQGRRATIPGALVVTGCVLRNDAGLKCAVGMLIPDDEYHPSLEAVSVRHLSEECPSLLGIDVTLLRSMQTVHDECWRNGDPFPEAAFREVATNYGLTYPEPQDGE